MNDLWSPMDDHVDDDQWDEKLKACQWFTLQPYNIDIEDVWDL